MVRDFLPKADLLPYLEAILRVYNLYGRRDNKFKARMKILVHEAGIDVDPRAGRGGLPRARRARMRPVDPELARRDRGRLRAARLRGRRRAAAAARVGAGLRAWVDTNVAAHKRAGLRASSPSR